jgi:hypothetical protein
LIPLFEACNAETAHIQAAHEKSSGQWMQTKMACSHLKRYRLFMRGISKAAAQREDEHKQQQEEEDD